MKANGVSFWIALSALLVFMMLSVQLLSTRPGDVLREVQELRRELDKKTHDRFYHAEFEAFLRANPELNRP